MTNNTTFAPVLAKTEDFAPALGGPQAQEPSTSYYNNLIEGWCCGTCHEFISTLPDGMGVCGCSKDACNVCVSYFDFGLCNCPGQSAEVVVLDAYNNLIDMRCFLELDKAREWASTTVAYHNRTQAPHQFSYILRAC